MRRAYAEGDWDLFEGQYFKEWRKEVHVCEPFEIPWYWKMERCGDWGEANPCAYYWIATNPEGQKWVCGEVYGAGMRIKEQAAKIKAFEAGKRVRKAGVLDGACFDSTGRDKSIADQFAEFGVQWLKSTKGRGSIFTGAQVLHTWLAFERGEDGAITRQPRIKVFSTCVHLIRTWPTLVHDKTNPENYIGEDHGVDAVRYHMVGPTAGSETPESEMSDEEAAFMAQADKQFVEGRI
jgi:phage terminase large subunit